MPAVYRLDSVKPKRPGTDSQPRPADLEERLPAAQEKSPVQPGNLWFPV
jgi:hypothetical protein